MKKNLKDWRMGSDLRNQINALIENVDTLIQENESLREELASKQEEIAEDIREELREEYDEKLADLIRQNERKAKRIEEMETAMNDCVEGYEQQIRDYKVAIMALRRVMACTVNNFDGTVNNNGGTLTGDVIEK